MRAIFMGTPEFSVPVLHAMKKAGHEILAVVTQPDKPKGRSKQLQASPVKMAALEEGLQVLQPQKIRDPEFIRQLKELAPEVMVVVAFGQILTKEILDMPEKGCINVHASLLPMYRGAAPIQQVILDGCRETGITTMFMDEGLDTGDMLLKAAVPISPDETGDSLQEKLSHVGADLLVETLECMEKGTLEPIPQEGATCYVGMLTKAMGKICWERSAMEIERQVRGLNSWPGAYSTYKGKTLKIWRASLDREEKTGDPGEIVRVSRDAVWVSTKEGNLILHEVQLEGKKRMETEAFLRGCPVVAGEKLGTGGEA